MDSTTHAYDYVWIDTRKNGETQLTPYPLASVNHPLPTDGCLMHKIAELEDRIRTLERAQVNNGSSWW